MKNKQMNSTNSEMLLSHVDEFLWRPFIDHKTIEAFNNKF